MKRIPLRYFVSIGTSAFVVLVFVLLVRAPGQTAAPKTAGQQFKNLQVLKDIPADQLVPSMQFIAGALGVDCEFCHVENAMDKDDKKEKQAARKMMAMELAINKSHFNNEIEVTCYTCHRGSPHPVSIPVLSSDATTSPAPEHHHEGEQENLPGADQILAKYLAAVGGADALHNIKTRIQKGTIQAMGERYPVEFYSEGPEQRVSISHPPFGESITAYNGQAGWLANPRGMHRMSAQEASAARVDAQLYFPARVHELFQELKVQSGETIAGHETCVIAAKGVGLPPVKLYFDQQSGLLLRQLRYAETPLGKNPTQIDYADYRDAGGVKIPFQWTLTRTNGTFTIRIDSIQQNVPIDEKLFVMPPPTPPAHP